MTLIRFPPLIVRVFFVWGFIVSCCQVMLGILRKGFEQFVALCLPDAMRSQRMYSPVSSRPLNFFNVFFQEHYLRIIFSKIKLSKD